MPSKTLTATFGLILVTFLFAEQDIWIAKLLKNQSPLTLNLWNFLVVMVLALALLVVRKKNLVLDKKAWPDMVGLNISTFTSWIFMFFALTRASPAVVAAGTLSAPLLIRVLLFEKTQRLQPRTWLLILLMTMGLAAGAVEVNSATHVQPLTFFFCLLASLGVVGNSYFMKRLHDHSVSGDQVLFYRFVLLVGSLVIYFLYDSGRLPPLEMPTAELLALAILTSYIPLLLAYYVHKHLEIFTINLFLALTPVFSIFLLWLPQSESKLNIYQLLSVVLILTGVLVGYKRESASLGS